MDHISDWNPGRKTTPPTPAGGAEAKAQWFATTHWSAVIAAGAGSSATADEALQELCRTYWPPLYAYIRRQGYDRHDAEDLTQGFFLLLLEKNFFGVADKQKGKLRSFLLKALNHFLNGQRDRANAAKRGGGKHLLSLDENLGEELVTIQPAADSTPETEFQKNWALTVLRRALSKLHHESMAERKSPIFEELKPFLEGDARPGEYSAVAARLGMTPNAVAVTVHRLRQRYRELVRAEIANTVASPEDIEDEMRTLFSVLS
jgi:DNA-directed RNA polymerase specialized sigma24 family protein